MKKHLEYKNTISARNFYDLKQNEREKEREGEIKRSENETRKELN